MYLFLIKKICCSLLATCSVNTAPLIQTAMRLYPNSHAVIHNLKRTFLQATFFYLSADLAFALESFIPRLEAPCPSHNGGGYH